MRGEPRIARLMTAGLGLRAPKVPVLGCDMAGQVEAVGAGVTEFSPGDNVFALLEAGGFAEYVCVPEHLLARMPGNVSYAQAAAVPMAAATALVALRDVGRVEAGQRVLVNGASGGVGLFAVQLARAFGATVDAVCSAANADQARTAGATDVIDYAREDFTRRGQRYDLLLDVAGRTGVFACRRALARQGTLVLIGGPAGRWVQPAGHVLASLALGPLTGRRTALADIVSSPAKKEILTTLATLIEDGKVTPVISRTYPFHELREAITYQEQGHAPAKVAVTV
jgi:NADPH:quinone reductase-like Zn-dependent oxidoreductase